MAFTVKDAMKLEYLDEFTLIAGNGGLHRVISTVGILDHEMIDGQMDVFIEGELVVTTLSVARDDESLVFDAIKALCRSKAAGLAFKRTFYETLSDEILAYADQMNFPIFSYDPSIFIENIIRTIFSSIKSRGIHSLLEAKLESLMSTEMLSRSVRQLAIELNQNFQEIHHVTYLKPKLQLADDELIRLLDRFNRHNATAHHGLFKLRGGLCFIQTAVETHRFFELNVQHMMDTTQMNKKEWIVGRSKIYANLSELNMALQESFYAFQHAYLKDINEASFQEIGIQKLLLSLNGSLWADKYMKELIEPIIAYDEKYNSSLLNTLILFYKHGCKTQVVSELLFQHKNTILYRVNKVKELLGPFQSDQDFHEQLSIAVKLYENAQFSKHI